MCKFCQIAREHGGKLCRPCWRKMYLNKKKQK